MIRSRVGGGLAVAALGLAVAACSASLGGTTATGAGGRSTAAASAPAASGTPVQLVVYGAASLKQVLARVATDYAAANPGTTLVVSTDSSAALETKIEQGAPADVFLSADTKNPQKLVDGGLAASAAVPFARNILTVVVPKDNPAGITTPADLARPGVKIVAAADSVPITAYASMLVDRLAAQPGYPPGFAAAYAANVVSREDNVSAVVAKIALGEGDAGIVYGTDARSSDALARVEVPAAANVAATYSGVTLRASPAGGAASAFLAWLAAGPGQAVLASFGFLPPTP